MAISASNVVTFPAPAVASGAEVRHVPNKDLPCSFPGCVHLRKARELCESHSHQDKAGLQLRPLRIRKRLPRNTDLMCTFDECGKRRFVGELCGAHYAQRQRGSELRPAATIGFAFCSRCKDPNKPRTPEFFGRRSRTGGLDSICRSCNRDEKQKNADREHAAYLGRTYGVSSTWYREQLVAQEGKCAICNSHDPGGKGRFSVDHDHATGAIRALLCAGCNCAIGYAKESPATLEAAAAYLRKFGRT